jgi:hypothetical protein
MPAKIKQCLDIIAGERLDQSWIDGGVYDGFAGLKEVDERLHRHPRIGKTWGTMQHLLVNRHDAC